MDKKNRWIPFTIAIVILLFSMNQYPKESVADLEGKTCAVDADCPCLAVNQSIYGIGVAKCVNHACDTNLCVDVEPTAKWLNDNPWHFLKTNTLVLFGIVFLLLLGLFWPKL